MKIPPSTLGKIVACSVMILPLIMLENAHAAARTWGNTGTDFNTAGNWTGGVPGTNDVGLFSSAPTMQPNVSASLAIAGLRFSDLTSGYNITGSAGAVLTLNGTSTTGSSGTTTASGSAIRNDNVTGTTTIGVDINLAPSTGISTIFQEAGDAGVLILSGNIGQTGTVALSLKNGTIQLNGNNSYSGGTSIDAAGTTVVVGNNNGLGTGAFTVNNTSNFQAGGAARTISNSMLLNGTLTINGSNALTVNGSVTGTGAASRTLTVTNSATTTFGGSVFISDDSGTGRTLVINGTGNVVINGVISNFNGVGGAAGTLSHGGTGTLTLNNANTYSGGTLLSGLNNFANANGAFGSGNVSLTAAAVTLTLQHGASTKGERSDSIGGGINDFIADTATFSIGFTDDVVNLNYTGTETVFALVVNGANMSPGVYGSADLPELFGTGTLTVVPEPSTWAMIVVGAGLLVATRLRRQKVS